LLRGLKIRAWLDKKCALIFFIQKLSVPLLYKIKNIMLEKIKPFLSVFTILFVGIAPIVIALYGIDKKLAIDILQIFLYLFIAALFTYRALVTIKQKESIWLAVYLFYIVAALGQMFSVWYKIFNLII